MTSKNDKEKIDILVDEFVHAVNDFTNAQSNLEAAQDERDWCCGNAKQARDDLRDYLMENHQGIYENNANWLDSEDNPVLPPFLQGRRV